MQLINNNN